MSRRPNDPPAPTVTASVSPPLEQAIQARCRAEGISRAQLVRQALARYFVPLDAPREQPHA